MVWCGSGDSGVAAVAPGDAGASTRDSSAASVHVGAHQDVSSYSSPAAAAVAATAVVGAAAANANADVGAAAAANAVAAQAHGHVPLHQHNTHVAGFTGGVTIISGTDNNAIGGVIGDIIGDNSTETSSGKVGTTHQRGLVAGEGRAV